MCAGGKVMQVQGNNFILHAYSNIVPVHTNGFSAPESGSNLSILASIDLVIAILNIALKCRLLCFFNCRVSVKIEL